MIDNIKLNNYRNISSINLNLNPGISILVQRNGFGKTNFLESIYYTIFRNSFRNVKTYDELINIGADFAKVNIEIGLDNLELVATSKPKLSRTVKLNGKRVPLKVPPEKFPILLFAPHSVDLVSGEPSLRRNDLDNVLSILNPQYSEWISKYKKILRNRNALIKAIGEGKATKKQLVYWTEEISKYGALIHSQRHVFFEDILDFMRSTTSLIYHDIKTVHANYIPNLNNKLENIENAYLEKYKENEDKEIIVGKTLYGVHKDDFEFKFGEGQSLRYQGSRGQQRLCSFIFKLAQHNLLKEKYDKKAVLLIDDIFSELDTSHRENIGRFLISLDNQIIMTGADINEFPEIVRQNSSSLNF